MRPLCAISLLLYSFLCQDIAGLRPTCCKSYGPKSSQLNVVSPGHNWYSSTMSSFDNPPFFPRTLEELAYDTSFSIRVALLSRVSRIRVDLRMRLLSRERLMLRWLLLTCENLADDEINRIHLFVDGASNRRKCAHLWEEMITDYCKNPSSGSISGIKRFKQNITISTYNDESLDKNAKLIIIFKPDNIFSETDDILDQVQAICFHGALRKIPTIIINPNLVATAWNNCGPRAPMLLSDFAQVYYACDDAMKLNRRDSWYGIIHRPSSGFEMFLLEGILSESDSPESYKRISSWTKGSPKDINEIMAHGLLNDPNFIKNIENVRNSRLNREKNYAAKPVRDTGLS